MFPRSEQTPPGECTLWTGHHLAGSWPPERGLSTSHLPSRGSPFRVKGGRKAAVLDPALTLGRSPTGLRKTCNFSEKVHDGNLHL